MEQMAKATDTILNVLQELGRCPLFYSLLDAIIETAQHNNEVLGRLLRFLREQGDGDIAEYIAMSLDELYPCSPEEVIATIVDVLGRGNSALRYWVTESVASIIASDPSSPLSQNREIRRLIIERWDGSDEQHAWGNMLYLWEEHQEAERLFGILVESGNLCGAINLATSAHLIDRVKEILPDALIHEDESVRACAIGAIGLLGIPEHYAEEVIAASNDVSKNVRREAIYPLAMLAHKNARALHRLIEMIGEDGWTTWVAADEAPLLPEVLDALLRTAAKWREDWAEDIVDAIVDRVVRDTKVAYAVMRYSPSDAKTAGVYKKLVVKMLARMTISSVLETVDAMYKLIPTIS